MNQQAGDQGSGIGDGEDESLWKSSKSLGFEDSYAQRRRLAVIALVAIAAAIILVWLLAQALG
ncbi:MAG TPA: hypothetical protein VGE07_20475 [Herpetosiphonaceae bacterium]